LDVAVQQHDIDLPNHELWEPFSGQ